MASRKTKQHRGGYRLDFNIPIEWWSGTDTMQTERRRAQRRHWVREEAAAKWKALKKQGKAWKVERFVALIAVAYPEGGRFFPARAAETIKPIIDGGSDARLWDDDDSAHRHSTVYIQMPGKRLPHYYKLTVLIIPVSDRNPKFQIAGGMGTVVARHWQGEQEKPAWADGYVVKFTIPDKQWITSNFTDSDLIARQRGARKAKTWGTGRTFGVREIVKAQLSVLAKAQWSRQSYCRYDRFIILAGIAYPYGVKQADPDNAAETVNAIMETGISVGAWMGVDSSHCKGVAFFRLPNLKHGGHVVQLLVMPVPPSFQIAEAVADAAEASWAEHDRRLG